MSGLQLMLGPVNDFIYRIHGDKSILICFQHIIHQGYILVFITIVMISLLGWPS